MRLPSNKKKVRGWKQQIRRLEQWKNRHLALDLGLIQRAGRDWVKIWIDPWDRLVMREPPFWLKRMMPEALIEIHHAWAESVREISDDYDVWIWLFDPYFVRSQVVLATGSWRTYYRTVFQQDEAVEFPYKKYDPRGILELDRFTWQRFMDIASLQEKSDELSPKTVARIKRRKHTVEELPDGDRMYTYKVGDVWVASSLNSSGKLISDA